ncbi:glycolate oxidase subunit GlcE [uncultured Thiodictyon sp.]|uniref:glycolate oxidase subunit GlcE n=1 Tax=uncultured Thiodictyon sp. TaxID=1846217 RepID=UPI0025CEEA81|nr:glycolate oxidase subunit GlcE [uncultured Thiodictyon sp.]
MDEQTRNTAAHQDLTTELTEHVRAAAAAGRPLKLRGAGTKSLLGRPVADSAEPLDLAGHAGIVNYQPKELVITARCGTTLDAIDAALAEQGQQIPFEPPRLGARGGPAATLGGTIACGLSGPARPYADAARDLVLGARVLTGRAEVLRFGGEVMKNVAGYDCSRLMVGAFGTLGVLLDISLKVMPLPRCSRTLVQACDQATALERMNRWAARPLPITATCWADAGDGGRLWVRLAGAEQGVLAAQSAIGGEPLPDDQAATFWTESIREQQHGFFGGDLPLWRIALPQATAPLDLPGPQLLEWGGAQRWLRSTAEPAAIRAVVSRCGGHATLFRGGERTGAVFHPLAPPVLALHRQLKHAFDPQGLLNPGRLYPEF